VAFDVDGIPEHSEHLIENFLRLGNGAARNARCWPRCRAAEPLRSGDFGAAKEESIYLTCKSV